jgi:hypothetical protein
MARRFNWIGIGFVLLLSLSWLSMFTSFQSKAKASMAGNALNTSNTEPIVICGQSVVVTIENDRPIHNAQTNEVALAVWLDDCSERVIIEALLQFKNIRKLRLDGTEVSDRVMEFVGGLADLESLVLYSTSVSNHGLEKIVGAKKLRSLDIFGASDISRGAVAIISNLSALEVLRLTETDVGDDEFNRLGVLSNRTRSRVDLALN